MLNMKPNKLALLQWTSKSAAEKFITN